VEVEVDKHKGKMEIDASKKSNTCIEEEAFVANKVLA
jgi:hypothetical protein